MIVDDEFLVRIGIKSMLDWEAHGYTIVAEAVNGKDAMEKIARCAPQLILTDLVMDEMDGLQLIAWCAEHRPDIRLVVLSNYNDFDKVKSAMKSGARDFLFKLTMTAEELGSMLDSLADEIDESSAPAAGAQALLNRNAGAIRKRLLRVMAEGAYKSEAEVTGELSQIGARVDFSQPYRVLLLRLEDAPAGEKPGMLPVTLENMIDELLREITHSQTFRGEGCECAALLRAGPGDAPPARLTGLFSRIDGMARQYLGQGVVGALSGEHAGVGGFAGALSECRAGLKRGYLMKTNALALPDDRPLPPGQAPETVSLSPWRSALARGCTGEAAAFLNAFCESVFSRAVSADAVREKLFEMSSILRADCLDKGVSAEELSDAQGRPAHRAIYELERLTLSRDALLGALLRYEALLRRDSARPVKKEIVRVVAFVSAHPEADTGIAAAARMAHMSESYFSRLFKSEMGVGFVDYVNGARMEKAKALLSGTDLLICEVAQAVGIENANYFSILFKKATGMPPGEYRLKKGG